MQQEGERSVWRETIGVVGKAVDVSLERDCVAHLYPADSNLAGCSTPLSRRCGPSPPPAASLASPVPPRSAPIPRPICSDRPSVCAARHYKSSRSPLRPGKHRPPAPAPCARAYFTSYNFRYITLSHIRVNRVSFYILKMYSVFCKMYMYSTM